METTLDLSRWREKPLPVSYRCWTISQLGLRQLMANRFFRLMLFAAWMSGIGIALIVFVFSQTVATGGWLESLAANLGVRFQAIAKAFGALVLLYPDVCVQGVYTVLFWLQSYVGLGLSLVALTMIIPQLIAKDQASNALTIYLSRPLTSLDYLLGKLGIVIGVLVLLWTGPCLAGWLLSLLLAPSKDFVMYSWGPFARALLFNAVGLAVLAPLALGVSSISRSSRNTVLLWLAMWLVLGTVASGERVPAWLRHASFSYNLDQARRQVLRVGETFYRAAAELPLMDKNLTQSFARLGDKTKAEHMRGATAGMAALVLLSSAMFFRRLRAE
jgi:ABC-2 type transport system permease protein